MLIRKCYLIHLANMRQSLDNTLSKYEAVTNADHKIHCFIISFK